MMHYVSPSVSVLTELSFIRPDEYLQEIGADEYHEAPTIDTAANLVMFAGRLCYRSFKEGLNPNVTRIRKDAEEYIQNIMKVGHGSVLEHVNISFLIRNVSRVFCYRDDTEILTRNGWKNISLLTLHDQLLTLNPQTRKAEWTYPKKLHAFPYEGLLYTWENAAYRTPYVTADHLMWVNVNQSSYQKIQASHLAQHIEPFTIDNEIFIDGVVMQRPIRCQFSQADCRTVSYHGMVYCPETQHGLVFVRRGETLSLWCGNTHELVRHRAGCAISQESMRFVRVHDIPIWKPDVFYEHEEASQLFDETVKYLEFVQQELARLYDINNPSIPFSRKKFLTSHFRRLLPEGIATCMVWTANVRSLRHIIQQRTSRHAEEEIRIVFGQIAEWCKHAMPVMFQDFSYRIVDQYPEWISPYASMPYDQEKIQSSS